MNTQRFGTLFAILLVLLTATLFSVDIASAQRSNIKVRTRQQVHSITDSTAKWGGKTIMTPVTVASAATTLTLPDNGTVFYVTGTGKATRIATSGTDYGRMVILRHNAADTLVDGGNLKLSADLNATVDDVITLIYSITNAAADTFWTEVSRSAN